MPPIFRELPSGEWHRLADFAPFDVGGLPDPAHWRMIVAEDDLGALVGFAGLFDAVHLEPFWIHPEYRGDAVTFKGLWDTSRAVLTAAGVDAIFCVVSNTLPLQQELVRRFGFDPAEGQLFLLYLPNARI